MIADGLKPYVYAAVAAALFGAGWAVNGWRLTATMERERSAAVTASAAELKRLTAERDALAGKLGAVDAAGTKELERLKNENDTLRGRVAAGSVRLRVAAVCPANTVSPTPGSSVDSGTTAVLVATAEQDYFALRDNIGQTETKLTACQDALKAFALPTP